MASAVVAICALGISFWQGYVSRDHNKRSVFPLINIEMDSRDKQEFELTATNVGLGPANITALTMEYNAEKFEFPAIDDFRKLVKAMGVVLKDNPCSANIPPKGRGVGVQQSFSVLKFDGVGTKPEIHSAIIKVLPPLRVTIQYESVYGNAYVSSYSASYLAEAS
jgi:hypothetical protein